MKEPIILCVDDEKIVLNSLRRELYNTLSDEYLIETAESGEEALAVFKEFLTDGYEIPLIISDQIMPGLKGNKLLQQIHALAPKTLKIMLTGQANLNAVTHAVNHANLYRYIAKPWEQTDFMLTVKEAIYKYFQDKKLEEQHYLLQRANQELAALNKKLKEYSHSLEQKVVERTIELEKANQELRRLADLDGLTRVANRRRFDEYFAQEWNRLAREQAPLALILGDIDYFKSYNDTYGHQAGDECLKQVAEAITHSVKRPADLVARYGGEEFTVILPNTDAAGAMYIAREIQQKIQALKIEHAQSTIDPYLTLSIGICSTIPNHSFAADTLVAVADKALYEAKTQGRNCIVPKSFESML